MKEHKNRPISENSYRSLIEGFLSEGKKLSLIDKEDGKITLLQSYDKKTISFYEEDVEKILERKDQNGERFLQINFKTGKKILITSEFIGFPPTSYSKEGNKKLPKVVTTADLLSVIEAIESSIYGPDQYQESLYDVRLFFEAIAGGAESAGFSLTGERLWVEKLAPRTPL